MIKTDMGRHSIKDFDPDGVAILDMQLLKAYYSHRWFRMFRLLVRLFREQFHVSWLTAVRLAYFSARAAVVFRRRENRNQTKAYLTKFYKLVDKHSVERLKPSVCAASELNWWLAHRYKNHHNKSLIEAVAKAKADFHSVSPAILKPFGKEYIAATDLRDRATHVDQIEPDWTAIQGHLKRAYSELHKAVNN